LPADDPISLGRGECPSQWHMPAAAAGDRDERRRQARRIGAALIRGPDPRLGPLPPQTIES